MYNPAKQKTKKIKSGIGLFLSALMFAALVFLLYGEAQAASVSITPNAGTFSVDSTFDVAVNLDTQGKTVNAMKIKIQFPPDKLQLVSPTSGKSFIAIWASPPSYNNQAGTIDLQGGVPGGISTTSGTVTKLTFRVKSTGTALVKVLDTSEVLLNDGSGTNVMEQANNGIFDLVLPPPAGPIVVSQTHPDQTAWSNNPNALLSWANEEEDVEEYSYALSDDPVSVPDEIVEGDRTEVSYDSLSDGKHYFHIRALRDGIWGGTTHFAINVDTTAPAEFPVKVMPSPVTSIRQPIMQFTTTDNLAGVEHYELKVIPLDSENVAAASGSFSQPFFIEVTSPFVLPRLELGKYDVVVRAYDAAKNYSEVNTRILITKPLFGIVENTGINIFGTVVSWVVVMALALLLLLLLAVAAWIFKKRHHHISRKINEKELPGHIKNKLKELEMYKQKYGKALLLLLCLGSILFLAPGFAPGKRARAATINPPIVSTYPHDISNKEIFYAGGKTEKADQEVILYIQNIETGETFNETVQSDKNGDWFYRHSGFLSCGNYIIWSQGKIGDILSPPSPQIKFTVNKTALQMGSSRISYDTVYLLFIFLLALVSIGLVVFIVREHRQAKRKRRRYMAEVREAHEAVRRGFAVLKRDIEAELMVLKKAKMSRALLAEERIREEQLAADMERIEARIEKEILDVETML